MTPDWAIDSRVLSDGRWLVVVPLTYSRARLTVSDVEGDEVYVDGW